MRKLLCIIITMGWIAIGATAFATECTECVAKYKVACKEQAKMTWTADVYSINKGHIMCLPLDEESDGWIQIKNGFVARAWFVCNEKAVTNQRNKLKKEKIASDAKKKQDKIDFEKSLALIGKGDWRSGIYNDEFGDPTGGKFINIQVVGTFSNSATGGDHLYVNFMISSDNNVGVFMREYNMNRPPKYFIGDDNVFMMKNSNGRILKITKMYKWNLNGGLSLDDSRIIPFLKSSIGIVKIVVHDGHSSRYVFKVNVNGFTKIYNAMRTINK